MLKIDYKGKEYFFRVYESGVDMYDSLFNYIIHRPEFSASIKYMREHLTKKDVRILLLERNRINSGRSKEEFKRQRNFIYCPECQNELISGRGYSSERLIGMDKDRLLEWFKCNECKTITKWDFDTPTPILVEKVEDK